MPIFKPFKALHYNPKKLPNLQDVVTPPYDAIPEGMTEKFWARSPYNFAHVILPKRENETYDDSKELLKDWQEKQVLIERPTPSFYVYAQSFELIGKSHVRRTLTSLIPLSDFSQGQVLPHENTFGKYKADRLKLLSKTQINLDHIFGMLKDPSGGFEDLLNSASMNVPLLDGTTDDGVRHTVWTLDVPRASAVLETFLSSPLYIVDGHHRYESALNFARQSGTLGTEAPSASVLFSIASAESASLIALPTHRILKTTPTAPPSVQALQTLFNLTPATSEAMLAFCRTVGSGPKFGIRFGADFFFCEPKNKEAEIRKEGNALADLPTHWSDRQLLPVFFGVNDDNRGQFVFYEKDDERALEKSKTASLSVFQSMPPTYWVTRIADEAKYMPQKSTFFYPKLGSGLLLRRF